MGRQFEPGRSVEMTSPKYGSGYRIGGRLVLTSAHLLAKGGADCRVRAKQSFGEVDAKVVWRAENADIALIELPESVLPSTPVVFGRLLNGKTGEKIAFQMYGYPLWARTHRGEGKPGAAGGRHIDGSIYLADRSPDGLLVLEAERLPPEASTAKSEWEGASGAAIVCDGLVVAVQRQHQNPRRPASLEAVPLCSVYADTQWRQWLERHGIEPEPKVVRLGSIGEQAEIYFQPYLQAILANEEYRKLQEIYTPTTVEDRRRMPVQDTTTVSQRRFSSRLKLRAEMRKPDEQGQGNQPNGRPEPQERVERWDVLAGLRNYAAEHVVLTGKPGSGKTTSLERLLWEEAEKALDDPTARIPVLVKLRRCTGAIEGLIRDFLLGHQVALEIAQIEELLRQGKFLLLLDGLNELPKAFETEVANFRDRYRHTTPMIVSTRDLGGGGTLGIEKKLKMLPLTKPQIHEFVRGYLGEEEGDRLFKQLQGDRLRKFAETPLLLWMLCRVFAHNGRVPDNLGIAFQEFVRLYTQDIQSDAPVDSREQWHDLLRHLGFVMMQGENSIDPQLSIPREEAEDCLTAYLQQKGRSNPRECAENWLKDLLGFHLIQPVIQPNFEEYIEFRHQLIQEYYAAECLLQRLPNLSNDELKQDYLNYLKWTEPIALMLSLMDRDKEAQSLRVVELALDVDLMLGARLAGEVKPEFQEETTRRLSERNLPPILKCQCLAISRSEKAVPELCNALKNPDSNIRKGAADALREIGARIESEKAIEGLSNALEDKDYEVSMSAAEALGQINTEESLSVLRKALNNPSSNCIRGRVVDVLGRVRDEHAIPVLGDVARTGDSDALRDVAWALSNVGNEEAIELLWEFLEHPDTDFRRKVARRLSSIDNKRIILKFLTALKNPDNNHHRYVIEALGNIAIPTDDDLLEETLFSFDEIGSNFDFYQNFTAALQENHHATAIESLLKAFDSSDAQTRQRVAAILGKLHIKEAVPRLLKALEDSDVNVRQQAAGALGEIGDVKAIERLRNLLESSPDANVRRSALESLDRINGEATDQWQIALNDSDTDIRRKAIRALGKEGAQQVTPLLRSVLGHVDFDSARIAIEALGKIGGEEASGILVQVLNSPEDAYYQNLDTYFIDSNSAIRADAATALGKIGDATAVEPLLQAFDNCGFDSIPNGLYRDNLEFARSVATALRRIGGEKAINGLYKALHSSHPYVRSSAALALGDTDNKCAIESLLKMLENESDFLVRSSIVESLCWLTRDIEVEKFEPILSSSLRKTLKDRDPNIHARILDALERSGNPLLLTDLQQLFQEKPDEQLKTAIISIQQKRQFYSCQIYQEAKKSKTLETRTTKVADELRNNINITNSIVYGSVSSTNSPVNTSGTNTALNNSSIDSSVDMSIDNSSSLSVSNPAPKEGINWGNWLTAIGIFIAIVAMLASMAVSGVFNEELRRWLNLDIPVQSGTEESQDQQN